MCARRQRGLPGDRHPELYARCAHRPAASARVEMLPFMRLYGAERTAYFLHTAAQEPVVLEDVDTIVLACPNRAGRLTRRRLRAALGIEHISSATASRRAPPRRRSMRAWSRRLH